MKRKFLIAVIFILIILAIFQTIYYNNIKDNVNNVANIENITENESQNMIYIYGMLHIYQDYNPKIDIETLEQIFYKFINVNIPNIHDNTNEKSIQELREYYEQNKSKINSMYIYSEEDFVIIAKQLQKIYTEKIFSLESYEIDTNTIQKKENGLISFDTIFYYDNSTTLKVKFTLSEKDESLEISSASDLDKIFENYTGSVKRSEFLSKLESFIPNVKDIRENSTLKSKNEKMQYYDLNKDKLNDIGIYSAEDFVTIANQVNTMKWKYSDISYISFEVDKESMTTDENYLNFIIKLYYTYDSETDLNIKLKVNSNNNEPDIRFSGVIKEAN